MIPATLRAMKAIRGYPLRLLFLIIFLSRGCPVFFNTSRLNFSSPRTLPALGFPGVMTTRQISHSSLERTIHLLAVVHVAVRLQAIHCQFAASGRKTAAHSNRATDSEGRQRGHHRVQPAAAPAPIEPVHGSSGDSRSVGSADGSVNSRLPGLKGCSTGRYSLAGAPETGRSAAGCPARRQRRNSATLGRELHRRPGHHPLGGLLSKQALLLQAECASTIADLLANMLTGEQGIGLYSHGSRYELAKTIGASVIQGRFSRKHIWG